MKTRIALLAVLATAGVANASVFTYAGPAFGIPDNTTGVVTSVNSNVGPITSVDLSLSFGTGASSTSTPVGNREHTWVGDLVITLTYTPNIGSPVSIDILRRAGRTSATTGFGRGDDLNGTYTFSDSATNGSVIGTSLWQIPAVGGNIPTGNYRPSTNLFTGVAASSYATTSFGSFNGLDGNGTWSLSVTDSGAGDVGDIVGWSVTVVPAPGALALVGMGGLLMARRRR